MKHWVEYLAYRTLAFVVPFLPRRVMVYVGRRLGGLYFLVHGKARRVGMENLRMALPERNDHRRILRESLRLQGVALLDALWSARLTPAQAAKYVDFTIMHESGALRYAGEGTGWVMATAHFGSWEMFNLAGGATDFPSTTIIAREIRNKRIDAHLRRRRERTGNKMVYRARAVPACIAALRRGEATCSVIDVAVLPKEGAVFVDFFGTPAATSGALPLLAQRCKAPLFFSVCRPLEGGYRYRIEGAEIPVDHDAERNPEIRRLTAALTRALEEKVRECPEAWMWAYKRWKWRPSELPGRFPAYSLWINPMW